MDEKVSREGAGRLDRSRTGWLRDRKERRREEDLGGKEEGFYSPPRRVFHPAEWPGKRLIRSFQDHRRFHRRNWREGRRCDCWRTPVGHWVSFRDGAAEVFFYFFSYSAVRVRHSVASSHLFFSFQPPSFFPIPSPFPPIPIRILFPFANPQYVSGPRSTPLGDAKGKSRPKERHRTGPELSTLIHSDSVPPSRYLLSCFASRIV